MKGKKETETTKEAPTKVETPTEKELGVIELMNARLEEAQIADGMFIVVCTRMGSKLKHSHFAVRMKVEDSLSTLSEIEKQIREANPRTPFNIHNFKPKIVPSGHEKGGE